MDWATKHKTYPQKDIFLLGLGVADDLAHHAPHAGVQTSPDYHSQYFFFWVLLIPNLRTPIRIQ